jgi:hypothetical protein
MAATGTNTLTAASNVSQGLGLDAGATGNDTLDGASGTPVTYKFGSTFGQDVINNNAGTSANGQVNFNGPSDQNLWFQQSGNNLQVDLLGTNDQITINNWFSGGGDQVSKFTAGSLTLDTQVSALVTAMATYAANNSGFNPTTAPSSIESMAGNGATALQNAVTSAWHT